MKGRLAVTLGLVLFSSAILVGGCGQTMHPPGNGDQASPGPNGTAVFESNGCGACHAPKAEGLGPSLSTIASAYAGKQAELVKFLAGEGQPIVDPSKFSMMKPLLGKTEALSAEKRSSLAGYILSH